MVVAKTFAMDTRVRREARALATHGFHVQILCWDRQGQRPSTEMIDQCSVRNIRFGRSTELHSSRLYYLTAALLFQAIIFLWAVRKIRKARALVLHVHDFNALFGSVMVRWLLKERVRLVYDCHELTPGIYQEWYGSLISRIVSQLEFVALRFVDAIIAANEAIQSYLCRLGGAPATVVYSCPAIEDIPEVQSLEAKRKLGLCNFFVILFSGRVRQDYDLDMILSTARDLRQNRLSDFRFVFIGPPDTVAYLFEAVRNEGLQDLFDFRGWVPNEDLLLYYIASDLCFAVTRDLGPNTRVLTPIKLFESMACGVPVVVRGGTLAAEIVKSWNCGIVLDIPRTSFSTELMTLHHNPKMLGSYGEAGRKAFRQEYNWDLMQARLVRLYSELWSSFPLPQKT